MRPLYLLCALYFIAVATGCDPRTYLGPGLSGATPENLRVKYEQGACFGTCEIYSLEVYNNGLLAFKGKRFTDRPGTWHKYIPRQEATSFLDSLNNVKWRQYPTNFPSRIPDMAATTITWYDGAQQPVPVTFKEEASPEVVAFAKRFKQLANLAGYRQVSVTIDEKADTEQPVAEGDRETIIVRLKEGADAGAWVGKYAKQGVVLKKQVSPNSPYYIVTANSNVMGAAELLEFLRRDVDVVSAQLNGSAGPRK